jgi:prepilin-type processing-associated H-X9-DG protein
MPDTTSKAAGVRPRSWLLGSTLFVVVASLAGFLLCTRQTRGHLVGCTANLMQIYGLALQYAAETGSFPVVLGSRAHDSLNRLVARYPPALPPSIFCCPESVVRTAQAGEGPALLDELTLSYAWTAVELKLDGPVRPLASDKYVEGYTDVDGEHHGHERGMNVLFTDGSIRFMAASELPAETQLPPGLTR